MAGLDADASGVNLNIEDLAMSLEGQTAIVTGAASGMGRATAELFVQAGASVIASDISPVDPATPCGELQPSRGDISDEDYVRNLVNDAAQHGLTSVVHCAGVSGRSAASESQSDPRLDTTLEIPSDLWERTIAINLTSGFLLLKYAMPHLVERGGGSVVLLGSTAGLYGGRICSPAYSASKAGLHGLTKWAANTHAATGVRVNGIAPGPIITPMSAKSGVDASFVPMGRMGQAVEVARLALFLASDAGSFVTGQIWSINGGTVV